MWLNRKAAAAAADDDDDDRSWRLRLDDEWFMENIKKFGIRNEIRTRDHLFLSVQSYVYLKGAVTLLYPRLKPQVSPRGGGRSQDWNVVGGRRIEMWWEVAGLKCHTWNCWNSWRCVQVYDVISRAGLVLGAGGRTVLQAGNVLSVNLTLRRVRETIFAVEK